MLIRRNNLGMIRHTLQSRVVYLCGLSWALEERLNPPIGGADGDHCGKVEVAIRYRERPGMSLT